MSGPSRTFATNAARQRAYRQRQREAAAGEAEEAQLTRTYAYVLQAAVQAAAQSGDPLARVLIREDAFATLQAVAEHFYDQAGTPETDRPWLAP
jgi:rRNA maturation endonuclease Nob1